MASQITTEETADHTTSPASPNKILTRGMTGGGYGRISTRGMNFNIPTNQGTHDHALDQNGEHSWRYKTVKFIHSSKIQIVLMAMLFCDVIILFIELLFLAEYPMCSIVERDAISCCPSGVESNAAAIAADPETRRAMTAAGQWTRLLVAQESRGLSGDAEEFTCEMSSLEPFLQYPATCDPEKWHAIHTAETFLFAVTIFILSTFMLELTVSMIALTPQVFFRQFFFLLDFVIITVSLVLEIVFHVIGDEAVYEYVAGFLVMGRIWRFIRIGHGIVEITNEMAHREYSDLLAYTEDLQDRLRQHNLPFPEMDEQLKKEAESEDNILSEV